MPAGRRRKRRPGSQPPPLLHTGSVKAPAWSRSPPPVSRQPRSSRAPSSSFLPSTHLRQRVGYSGDATRCRRRSAPSPRPSTRCSPSTDRAIDLFSSTPPLACSRKPPTPHRRRADMNDPAAQDTRPVKHSPIKTSADPVPHSFGPTRRPPLSFIVHVLRLHSRTRRYRQWAATLPGHPALHHNS